nr:hypothetical protein CFP56_72078 [Quercus suber]
MVRSCGWNDIDGVVIERQAVVTGHESRPFGTSMSPHRACDGRWRMGKMLIYRKEIAQFHGSGHGDSIHLAGTALIRSSTEATIES